MAQVKSDENDVFWNINGDKESFLSGKPAVKKTEGFFVPLFTKTHLVPKEVLKTLLREF